MIIVLQRINDDFIVSRGPLICPSFSMLHVSTHFSNVFADAVQGCFTYSGDTHQLKLEKIDQPLGFVHKFVTALGTEGEQSIAGDVLGNISSDKIFFFNIGDQINTIDTANFGECMAIIGTLHGGIYSLHEVSDRHKQRFEFCINELLDSPYSNVPDRRWKLGNELGKTERTIQKGVIDLQMIKNFLKSYNSGAPISMSKFRKCIKNIDILTQIYNDCTNMGEYFDFEYEREA
ncbi:hypothetical protein DFJ63DRAFT_314087 [Scheffersomyces coipomensis]|uniref:uncharacterized protein n=1 Tax=Scheffersomyces coipomensis TaxID=1788519 RepID=UPI00315D4BD8